MFTTTSVVSRTFILSTLFALATCVPKISAQSNWEPVNTGLGGGEAKFFTIAADGAPILAAGTKIYRGDGFNDSNPLDGVWQSVLSYLIEAADIERATDGALFARNRGAIYRSTDDGRSWRFFFQGANQDCAPLGRDEVLVRTRTTLLLITETAGKQQIDTLAPPSHRLKTGPDGTAWSYADREIGVDFIEKFNRDTRRFEQLDVPSFPQQRTVDAFLPINDSLYVTVGADGLKRTTDGGSTWETLPTPGFGNYMASEDGTLSATSFENRRVRGYRSTDTGRTWQRCLDDAVGTIITTPEGVAFRINEQRIDIAPSCGAAWQNGSDGLEASWVTDIQEGPEGNLYTTLHQSTLSFDGFWTPVLRLHRSTDGGKTWQYLRDGINDLVGIDSTGGVYVRIDSIDTDDDLPYATIYRSQDGGTTWQHVARGSAPYQYFFGPGAGGHVPDVNGHPIAPVSFFHPTPDFLEISIRTVKRPLTDCNRLFSNDGGATFSCWSEIFNPRRTRPTRALLVGREPTTIYVMAEKLVGDPGFEVVIGRSAFLFEPKTGDTQPINAGYEPNVRLTTSDGQRLYSLDEPASVLHTSSDRGASWQTLPLPAGPRYDRWFPVGLGIDEDGDFFVSGVRSNELGPPSHRLANSRLLHSSDAGATWNEIEKPGKGGFPVLGHNDDLLDTIRSAQALLMPFKGEVMHNTVFTWSTDNGQTWHVEEDRLRYTTATAFLTTSSGSTFIGTQEAGLFRRTASLSDVDPPIVDPVIDFHLTMYMRPNPVSTEGSIYLFLDRDVDIELALYDLLGRRVTTIVNEPIERGAHRIDVNVTDMPPGVYLLRVSDGKLMNINKFVVR